MELPYSAVSLSTKAPKQFWPGLNLHVHLYFPIIHPDILAQVVKWLFKHVGKWNTLKGPSIWRKYIQKNKADHKKHNLNVLFSIFTLTLNVWHILSSLSVKCFPYLNINNENSCCWNPPFQWSSNKENLCLVCGLPSAHKPNYPHASHLFPLPSPPSLPKLAALFPPFNIAALPLMELLNVLPLVLEPFLAFVHRR